MEAILFSSLLTITDKGQNKASYLASLLSRSRCLVVRYMRLATSSMAQSFKSKPKFSIVRISKLRQGKFGMNITTLKNINAFKDHHYKKSGLHQTHACNDHSRIQSVGVCSVCGALQKKRKLYSSKPHKANTFFWQITFFVDILYNATFYFSINSLCNISS